MTPRSAPHPGGHLRVCTTELSPVEREVLRDAANGLTGAESARQLGKSPETVKTQRSQIVLKLGARNLANAVSIGVTAGIVTPD